MRMRPLKTLALAAALALPVPALSDGYILGAGRWRCADALRIQSGGTPIEIGQLVGWVLGYWSAETFNREAPFIDVVERAGGEKIYKATLAECQKAPPETLVAQIVQAMIRGVK